MCALRERGAPGPASTCPHFLPRAVAVTCLTVEGQSLVHPPNSPWKSGSLGLLPDGESESRGGSPAGSEMETKLRCSPAPPRSQRQALPAVGETLPQLHFTTPEDFSRPRGSALSPVMLFPPLLIMNVKERGTEGSSRAQRC